MCIGVHAASTSYSEDGGSIFHQNVTKYIYQTTRRHTLKAVIFVGLMTIGIFSFEITNINDGLFFLIFFYLQFESASRIYIL
jgi:uncharacterized membrane protein YiaA